MRTSTWHKRTSIPRRIKGKLSETMEGEPEEIARAFLSERKELFGVSDADKEFVLRRVDDDTFLKLINHEKFRINLMCYVWRRKELKYNLWKKGN